MGDFAQSLRIAFELIVHADPVLIRTVALSLAVSGSACAAAAVFGLVGGAWLAVAHFPGHRVLVWLLNTLLALPSVLVGLVVYLLLSRSGPLGSWGLLLLAIWLGSVSSIAWKAGSFLWWGMEIGHMAFFSDTEGNTVAMHSQN